jgi:hypothetical protein
VETVRYGLPIWVLLSRMLAGALLVALGFWLHLWVIGIIGVLIFMFGGLGNLAVRTVMDSTGIAQTTPARSRNVAWQDVTEIKVVKVGFARRVRIESSGSTKVLVLIAPQSSPLGWDREFDAKVEAIRSTAARFGPPSHPPYGAWGRSEPA